MAQEALKKFSFPTSGDSVHLVSDRDIQQVRRADQVAGRAEFRSLVGRSSISFETCAAADRSDAADSAESTYNISK